MTIDTAKLRVSTKSLVGAAVTVGALFQIPAVHDALIAAAHDHPHITGVISAVAAIVTLMHNPQVQDVLGIKQTVEVKTETVTVAPPDAVK